MTILIAGASGNTGRLLVKQLLDRGHHVKAIVRSREKFLASVGDHEHLTVTTASILDLSDAEIAQHVRGCDAVASCLGHNLTFKGLYGTPRKLVRDATRRLCHAIKANASERPVKFVLMNTTGNRNRDLNEPRSLGERIVISLLRALLPPHSDNEQAAEHLRTTIGQNNNAIEWSAVRPDTLINTNAVSDYTVHSSPVRSPIFNAGKTSRINVAHFMADLITEKAVWEQWKGQMPVVYNAGFEKA